MTTTIERDGQTIEISRITITALGRELFDVSVWMLHPEDAGDERVAESNTLRSRAKAAAWAATTYPNVPVNWR